MPSKAQRRQKWNEAGENKVILHQFGRAKTVPNSSPFCLKLETFLRMANIDYENDFEEPMGSKGKSPWITFNKEEYCDSQFIIDMLSEKLEKDMNKNLDDRQKAIARSLRVMLEEHLYFAFLALTAQSKGKYMKNVMAPLPVPGFLQGFVFNMMMKNFAKTAQAQGMGRHTKEEIEKFAIGDLQTLQDYLMNKPYIMGNEPTEIDACAFAFLAGVYATDPENDSDLVKAANDMEKLKDYFGRMKEKYWADWDDNLYKEPVKPEKKKKEEKKKDEDDKEEKKEDEEKKEEKKDEEEKKD